MKIAERPDRLWPRTCERQPRRGRRGAWNRSRGGPSARPRALERHEAPDNRGGAGRGGEIGALPGFAVLGVCDGAERRPPRPRVSRRGPTKRGSV